MRFGFDLDDTIINLRDYALKIYSEELQQVPDRAHFERLTTIGIFDLFNMTKEQENELWHKLAPKIYSGPSELFPHAQATLTQLAAEGHDIFYITARESTHCTITEQWLQQRGLPLQKGHLYCGMADDEKAAIITDLKLDYYVDDKAPILHSIAHLATQPILKDQSYNQQAPFPRLYDWKDFFTLLNTLK